MQSIAKLIACCVLALAATTTNVFADPLVAWGRNTSGQLGIGAITPTQRASALPVQGISSDVAAAAAGTSHGLLLQSGSVLAWGSNDAGQLGDGTTNDHYLPLPIPELATGVTAIAGGESASLAIKGGALYHWGSGALFVERNTPHVIVGLSSGVTAVTTAEHGTFAIKDGALYEVRGVNVITVPVLTQGITAVAAGEWHSIAIKNGGVYSWGQNFNGSLGTGSTESYSQTTPTAVTGLTEDVTAISTSSHANLAVRNGFVYSWGWNSFGQLGIPGNNLSIPTQIPGLRDIVAVASGYFSAYALASDGTLWAWGSNDYWQLGYVGAPSVQPTPRQVTPPAGYRFTGMTAQGDGNFVLATIAPACPADFGSAGGAQGPDGHLNNNDFIAFINAFFAHDSLADMGSAGGFTGRDGQFDNNDFIVFIETFFGGC